MRRLAILTLLAAAAHAQNGQKWVTSWAASVQGPYPSGNASAQPDLRFAFPNPAAGARDQTFRLMMLPDLWGKRVRVRFSNVFGTRPVTFDGVYAGLAVSGGALVRGANRQVHFDRKESVTIAPGKWLWSDAVDLPFVNDPGAMAGRRLAISFHIGDESGPMTWHAKGLTTSYVSRPGSGALGSSEDEAAFPFTTTSWYFVDAIDVMAPSATKVVVALGDSITDGTASTLNGDDRWPNALARRLHAAFGDRVAVVNAGIGGNRVSGPEEYSVEHPFAGGPSALQRLDRDVLSLSGVAAVIWLEGINDFATAANAPVGQVTRSMREGVERMRAQLHGVRVIGATVVSAIGSTNAAHGSAEEDRKRRELNQWIRSSGVFDAVADFDQATLDPVTGGLRPEFVPDSTTGGPGDKLHPNRAGYLAMAAAIDLQSILR